MENWLYDRIEIKLNLCECELLFGIPNAVNDDIALLHFVIIITKWYINCQRYNDKPLLLFELLNIIRNKVQTLITANSMNDRANKPWQDR